MKFAKLGLMATMILIGALTSVSAHAATFLFSYSGAAMGNSATAAGSFDIADSALQAIDAGGAAYGFPTNLVMTVKGAGVGNGVFTSQNFVAMLFQTSSPLDFSTDLIGQKLANGAIFGSSGGEFNLFSITPHAPLGVSRFILGTNNGFGPRMSLTSLIATTPVPEPATWAMLILGLAAVGFTLRRTRRAGHLAQA